MNPKFPFYLYIVVSALNVASHLLEIPDLEPPTKGLLMPLLLTYVYLAAKGSVRITTLYLAGAIIFSWIGDLALLDSSRFIYGLGAFFIAQFLYVVLFYKDMAGNLNHSLKNALPFIAYGALFMYLLVPKAPGLEVAIIVYGVALLAMGYMAISVIPFSRIIPFQVWI